LIQEQGRSNKIERLITYPLLHDAHNLWPEFLEQLLPRAPLSFKKNVRFNQRALAIDAAVADQGMALAHVAFVEADVTAGRLVHIFPIEMATGAGFYLVSPRKPHDGELIASVRKWFLQQAWSRGAAVPL
jgi:LysR family transcriptional regulator, glycine cleavage system transcriptional activator